VVCFCRVTLKELRSSRPNRKDWPYTSPKGARKWQKLPWQVFHWSHLRAISTSVFCSDNDRGKNWVSVSSSKTKYPSLIGYITKSSPFAQRHIEFCIFFLSYIIKKRKKNCSLKSPKYLFLVSCMIWKRKTYHFVLFTAICSFL
jgi:hypothetical protein